MTTPTDDDAKTKALLKALKQKLGAQRFAALIEMLDEDGPEALLQEALRSAAGSRARAPDFPTQIQTLMAPLLARADEKAGLLIDALAAAGHDVDGLAPKGFRPTVVKLAARFGEEAVLRAAEGVMAQARAFGALRESVV